MEMTKKRGNIPRKVRGFRDDDPGLTELKQKIITKASEVYKSYGFEHWDTPVLEYADCLGKYLPDEDTVDKGVYSFKSPELEPVLGTDGKDLKDEQGKTYMDNHYLSLRYDLTAPLARMYAEKLWMDFMRKQVVEGKAPMFKRFQYGPVFRYEVKIEPGRYRQFGQIDFDTVGAEDVMTDAESCMILSDALEACGVEPGNYVIKANNRKMLSGYLRALGVADQAQEMDIIRVIDKADKISMTELELELGPGRKEKSGANIKGLGLDQQWITGIMDLLGSFSEGSDRNTVLSDLDRQIGDNELAREGLAELHRMNEVFSKLGFDESRICFDPTLVRGLGYYTGPVFEAISLQTYKDAKGKKRRIGSICGGGRYDGLVENLLGMKVPATGASIGIDRLADVLISTGQDMAKAMGPVLIVMFDDNLMMEYQLIAQELRQSGIDTEIFYGARKQLKKQLSYADKKNCPVAVLIGEDELAKSVVTVRNLALGKELSATIADKQEWKQRVQKEVQRADLVSHIRSIMPDKA